MLDANFIKSYWNKIVPPLHTSIFQFICTGMLLNVSMATEIDHDMFNQFMKVYPKCILPDITFSSVSDSRIKFTFKDQQEVENFKEKWEPIIRTWINERKNIDK